jgi:putative tryptophan/tyrosine transport system substrate-binding protein
LNPNNFSHPAQATRLTLAAQKIGVQIVLAEAGKLEEIETAFASLAQQRAEAVILFGDTFFAQQLQQIARTALRHRLPSIYILREYAEAGGLMSFGAPIVENFRRAASYVDKILRGAVPGDLPFEQPKDYGLAINVKTASVLGLTIPKSLLFRASYKFE